LRDFPSIFTAAASVETAAAPVSSDGFSAGVSDWQAVRKTKSIINKYFMVKAPIQVVWEL
jgi:hypothetical protein